MKIQNTNHHGSSAAMPTASSPSRSCDIPNVSNTSRHLELTARSYQIILWIPSLVVTDGGPLRKVRGFVKHSTWWIANRTVFTLALDGQRFWEKMTESRKVINGRSRERVWEGPNFKDVPHFLKRNRISLAYGLTNNKDQTLINKNWFVFLLYRGICRFCAIFGRLGRMALPRFALLIRLWRSWLPTPS